MSGARAIRRPRREVEAGIQRAIVQALHLALPPGSIIHHSPNEQRGHDRRAKVRQAILQGMGVEPGFPDLIVLSDRIALLLEVKSPVGRQSPDQKAMEARARSHAHRYQVVRSVEDALDACRAAGMRVRLRCAAQGPPGAASPGPGAGRAGPSPAAAAARPGPVSPSRPPRREIDA